MTEAVTAAPTQGAQKGVRIRALGHRFGDNEVLRDIDLDIRPGESVALVGPSGSGKSTLVSLLTGALELQTGSIQYDGETVAKGNRPFAFMPQRDVLMPWRNILDNTAVGLSLIHI